MLLRRGLPSLLLASRQQQQQQQQRWLHASPIAMKGRRTGSKAHLKNYKKPYRRKPPKKKPYMRVKEHKPPLWRDGKPFQSMDKILAERKKLSLEEREKRAAQAAKELFSEPSYVEFEKQMEALLASQGYDDSQEQPLLPDPSDTSLPARIDRLVLSPGTDARKAYAEARALWRFAQHEPSLAKDLNKPETWLGLLKAARRAKAFDDCVAIADAAFDALPEQFNDNVDGCSSQLVREVVRVAVDTKRIASAWTTFNAAQNMALCDGVPDAEYSVLLVRCMAEQQLPERALKLVEEMRGHDVDRTPALFAALLNAVATAPQWHRAYARLVDDVLDDMQGDLVSPTPEIYVSLIRSAGRCGDARAALHWFDEMKSRHNMVRDDRAYTTLFAALAKAQTRGTKRGTKRRALVLPPWVKLGLDPQQATIQGHDIDRHIFEQYVKDNDVVVEQTAVVRKKDVSTRKLSRRPLTFKDTSDYETQMGTAVERDYLKEGGEAYLELEEQRKLELEWGQQQKLIGDGAADESSSAVASPPLSKREEDAIAELDRMAMEIAAMESEDAKEAEEDEEETEEDVIIGEGYEAPKTEEDRLLQEFLSDPEGQTEMSKLLDSLGTQSSSAPRSDDADLPQMLTPEQLKELRDRTREMEESAGVQELVEQHEREMREVDLADVPEIPEELTAMLRGREDELDFEPEDTSFEEALAAAGQFPTPGFEEDEDKDELEEKLKKAKASGDAERHREEEEEEEEEGGNSDVATVAEEEKDVLPSLRATLVVADNKPWGEVTRLRELGNDWESLDISSKSIHARQEANIAIAKKLFEEMDFAPSAATLNAYFSVYTEGMRRKRAREVAEQLAAKYPNTFPDNRSERHLTLMLTRRGEIQAALASVREDEDDIEVIGALLDAASRKGKLELAHKLAEKLIAAQKKRNLRGIGASDHLPKFPKLVRLGVLMTKDDFASAKKGVPERLLRSYRQLCRTRKVPQPEALRQDPILFRQEGARIRRHKGNDHELRKANAKIRSLRRQF